MREYAKISPRFWINELGRKIRKLGGDAQLISLYLLTNPHANMIGVYYLPINLIAHETGLSYEIAAKALLNLCEIEFCSYDEVSEYIWVHDMALDQIAAQLKPQDNRVKAIREAFDALPKLPFIQAFYDKYESRFCLQSQSELLSALDAPLHLLQSQEKEKEKEKENEKEKEKEKKNIDMSGKPDVESLKNFSVKNEITTANDFSPSSIKSQAIEILAFLNEKTGRAYRPVESNIKLIIARLRTGATVMDCRQVIAKKTREWKGDAKMAEYLRPATLFNSLKFEQYMGELVLHEEEVTNEVN